MVAVTKSFGSLLPKLVLQILGKSSAFMGIWVIQGLRAWVMSQAYKVVQGGICKFCVERLDRHKNSDLRSKLATGTV